MQLMLDICSKEAENFDFSLNTKKFVALWNGPRFRHICAPLTLCNVELQYVDKTKYLGVELLAARSFKCSFERAKIKFYRCFNAMMCKAQNSGNELIWVHLSMSLPIILYAVEAV